MINECFFLGTAAVELVAPKGGGEINGLTVLSNEWDGGDGRRGRGYIVVNQTQGNFTRLLDTFIDQNMIGGGYGTMNTRLTTSLQLSGVRGRSCFDLRTHLLFPQFKLQYVQATLYSGSEQQAVWLSSVGPVNNSMDTDQRQLCFNSDSPVKGLLYVEVDQSEKTGQATINAAPNSPTMTARHSVLGV